MAEGGNTDIGKNTLPQRGKVRQVSQQWAVHEDGALAHVLQNEENDRHYGLNRFNRRTVREDIPIAKVVQTDEEVRQQNERFQELSALKAQAEEDARVAKQMMEQEQLQTEAHKMARELTDEEFAKAVQEKEKKKYERYLEKKKSQKLKQERQEIEHNQQLRTEDARLNVRNTGSTEDLDTRMSDVNIKNGGAATRVTPHGRIEDDGDFSDFYNLPQNIDPAHRQALQEIQDEELAKLLQDQEHKRSNAQVDKSKLKEIEEQDKRLAQIIQEQEKIKVKKAKQKHKQKEDLRRAQEAQQRPPALPPRPNEHDHRRYRRNSFILSMENDPDENGSDPGSPGHEDGYMTPLQAAAQQRLHSAGDIRGQIRSSDKKSSTNSDNVMNNSRQSKNQSREIKQNKQNVQQVKNNLHSERGRELDPAYLPAQEMPDVERWLASHPPEGSRGRLRSDNSEHLPDSPSPPGSYHSEDAFQYSRSPQQHNNSRGGGPHNMSTDNGSHYAVSDPFNFNIAAAIDPTYTRRSVDGNTDRKQPVPVISTRAQPPQEDLEWEPSVRGSIRRGSLPRLNNSASYNNGYKDRTISTVSSRDSFPDDGPGVVSQFAPVQGQKRSGDKARKSRRQDAGSPTAKQQNKNCKQQ